MSNVRNLAVALLASAPLLACSQPPAAPVPPAAPAAPAASDTHGASSKGFIGRHVEEAIAEARKELATENIGISDGFNINVNGREINSKDSNLPKAEITPQGDLLIEGKAVSVTPVQRQQLLAYRGQIIGIAEAGMAIGVQGADIAGEALSGVVGAIFGGKDGEKAFEQRMEAQGKKIEAEAMKLCTKLPGLMASQQVLAASLPAFKPYARMTQTDVDDCAKEKDTGAVGAAVRDQTRAGIQSGIRDSIRSAVRPGQPTVDRMEASPTNLIEAVEAQRIDEIRRQVKAGVDVNTRVRGDGTPLIRAAAGSDLATVDALIRLGADVNKSSRGDGNPLIAAAKGGRLDIVKRLVAAGAAIDAVVPGDETALINAARSGHLDVVTYLVERGANVNQGVFADYGRWRSPLNQATDADVRKYLQGKGARAGRDA